jgi:hypothetical protein
MSNNEQMTIDERRKHLRTMKKRYVKANHKKSQGLLLDEMEAVTALDRKTLIRSMNGSLERRPRSRARGALWPTSGRCFARHLRELGLHLC